MKLNELKPGEGSRKVKTRKARGHAGPKGKQAGLGQSGQKKRSKTKQGFEGGQNPWFRRVPKRGFNNINKKTYEIVSLQDLDEKFKNGDTVDYEKLKGVNLVNKNLPVKVLNNGKLSKKITLRVNAISKSALVAVEKLGGKVEFVQ